MGLSVNLRCAACKSVFLPGDFLFNEYCLSCYRRLCLFKRTPEKQPPVPKSCLFCSSDLPKGGKKFCDPDCRRWFWRRMSPQNIHKQICLVCKEVFRGPLGQATCSKSCGSVRRSESRALECSRCGASVKRRRRLCDPCWTRMKTAGSWQKQHRG